MYDGSIKILTKISTEGFDKGKQHLERGLSKLSGSMQRAFKGAFSTQPMSKEFERARLKVQDTEMAIASLAEQMEAVKAQMASAGVEGSDQFIKLKNEAEKYSDKMQMLDEQYQSLAKKKMEEMGIEGMPESAMEGLLKGDKELEKLANASDKAQQSLSALNRKMDELRRSGDGLTYPHQKELRRLEGKYNDQLLKLKQYESRLEQTSNVVVETNKKAQKQVSATGRMMKRMFLRMLIFAAIALVMRSITQGMKNLAQVSDGANKTLSELSASFTKLKNALATAVLPILQAIAPALLFITNALANLFTMIGMITSRITGNATTIVKAKKAQVDYAKSLDGTAKSAKKAVGALAGFDELDVLNQQAEAGGAGGPAVADMFEEVQIPENVLSVADKIKSVLKDIINLFKPLSEPLGRGVRWFIDNVLAPLGRWTMNILLPSFLNLLEKGIEALGKIIKVFEPAFLILWEKLLKPIAEWTGGKIIEFLDFMAVRLENLGNWFESNQDVITGFFKAFGDALNALWKNIVEPVLNWMHELFKKVVEHLEPVWGEFIRSMIIALTGLAEFLAGVFTGDWKRAWEGLKIIVVGVWNGIVAAVEGGLNLVIKAINHLVQKANSLLSKIDEVSPLGLSFRLPTMSEIALPRITNVPRLATGAVIPPNAEFLAVLGDQRHGRNIEAPESLLRQIVAEESGETVIRFEGNLGQLMRVLKPYIDKENKRVGVSLVEGTI